MTSERISPAGYELTVTPEKIHQSLGVVAEEFRRVGPGITELAGKVTGATDKQDGSPVTEKDKKVEEILKEAIESRTGIPAYGEETGYDDDHLPRSFWLIDPIDGTRDFIEGVPHFTTMGVLIHDKEAVAAAIYNPSTDEMYTTQKGRGAYKNGELLDLRTISLPPTVLCKELFIPEITAMLAPKGVRGKKAPRGGGFGFTMVLDGLTAARFNLHGGGYTHDYAPGALLVQEAGGCLVPILEDEYTYRTRSFVACHPDLESTIRPHVPRLRELELLRKDRK